ncbi:hypothetical protein GCM10007971_35160 [Oceanobacillus indicireducens]|uniref:Uncharacterized protein n=1 Tax=Oceanobacillus indicireducens TaxID=1004261 RepID=A0A917Y333_9BACI|nr:hypothetical protein GCM10007971_35160 [Oceanobacillus indicireducens]
MQRYFITQQMKQKKAAMHLKKKENRTSKSSHASRKTKTFATPAKVFFLNRDKGSEHLSRFEVGQGVGGFVPV